MSYSRMDGFAKGIAIGIAAGTAIGVITAPKTKEVRRSAGKFARVAGNIIEDIGEFWK